jgi:hypothetical protein
MVEMNEAQRICSFDGHQVRLRLSVVRDLHACLGAVDDLNGDWGCRSTATCMDLYGSNNHESHSFVKHGVCIVVLFIHLYEH